MPEKKPCRDWRPEKGESFLSLRIDEVAMCFFVLGKDEVEKVSFLFGVGF